MNLTRYLIIGPGDTVRLRPGAVKERGLERFAKKDLIVKDIQHMVDRWVVRFEKSVLAGANLERVYKIKEVGHELNQAHSE